MFRRISHRLALRFTGFVFLLLMLTGAVFLAADMGNARRLMNARMERASRDIMRIAVERPFDNVLPIPPHLRERVRIVAPDGNVLYAGGVFEHVSFDLRMPVRRISVGGDEYIVMTRPIVSPGGVRGFVQLAEVEPLPQSGLPVRVALYLAVSLLISGLTYLVGLWFARRSLQPAQEAMDRLEQFTQDASHELRTPIATVNSTLDLALRTGEYEERVKTAKKDLRHMADLVDRLLGLARLDGLLIERRRTDVNALVRDAAESFAAFAKEKGVDVRVETEEGVTVDGDPALIREVIDNLLGNAIKYGGKSISIRVTKKALAVTNDGPVIDPAALPRVFDRFYQADASRSDGGFGLGLALVKRVADLHGWSVEARSAEGSGTVFIVRFS